MKKQVPITVVSNAYLNQTAVIPETVIFTSDAGGLYLVASCQEVFDRANDNATALIKYSDQFQNDIEIELNSSPGWQDAKVFLVKAGGDIVFFTNNVNINPGGFYNVYIAILEL